MNKKEEKKMNAAAAVLNTTNHDAMEDDEIPANSGLFFCRGCCAHEQCSFVGGTCGQIAPDV